MGQRRLSPQVIWLKNPVSIGVTKTADFAVSWGYNADDNPENTIVTTLYADATKIWSISEGALLPGGWSWTLYPGTETQMPDPTMLAVNGALETPAYRGQIYGVFKDFPLEKFGYKLPGISAEIVGSGPEAPRNDSWNPGDRHPFVVLESPFTLSKLVPAGDATVDAFSATGVRSRTFHRRGQYYFELTLNAHWTGMWSGFAGTIGIGGGVSLASSPLTNTPGNTDQSVGVGVPSMSTSDPNQRLAAGHGYVVTGPDAWGPGETVGLHINMDEGWAKGRNVSSGGAWTAACYYVKPQNPTFAEIEIGDPLYAHASVAMGPATYLVEYADRQTVNFGASPFLGAIPAGATAWNGDGGTTGALGVVPLRDFISKIAIYCGLVPEDDLDFVGIDDVIHGGLITKDTTFTDFLSVLGRAYGFDYFEGEQIRIVRRVVGSTYVIDKAIPQTDLIVEGDRAIATNRRRDDSPNEIELSYIDVTQQFRWNIQRGRRILFPVKSTTSRRKDQFAIPIITTANDALTMATKAMFRDAAQNVDHAASLLPKHMNIEPSDIITLTAGDTEYTVKVTTVSMNVDGRVSLTAVNLLTDEDMALEADPGTPNLPYSGGRWEWSSEEGPDEMHFSQDLPGILIATDRPDTFAGSLSTVALVATDRPDVFAGAQAAPIAVALSGPLEVLANAAVGEIIGILSASGGTAPYTFSEQADAGNKFTVASNGVVTLSATVTAGTYAFTARATDAGSITGDQAFTITVTANSASYANAGGTGNRTSSITATTFVAFAGGAMSNLINGTVDNVAFFAAGSPRNGFAFDFGAATYKNITEITWKQSNTTTHGNWFVLASNDNSNWRVLTAVFLLGSSTTQTIALTNNPYGYRYYRLIHHIRPEASSSPWIQEIEFKIMAGPQAPDISTIPDYGNAGGVGERTSIVTLTVSNLPFLQGSLAYLLDGYISGSGSILAQTAYQWSGASAGAWIKFDFGSAKKITEATVYGYGSPTALGTWKYQGSPDNSTWTDIGSSFSWTTAEAGTVTDLSANTASYRYYRLLHVSGAIGNGTLSEFEFKISS
jgi:hypothetical protein